MNNSPDIYRGVLTPLRENDSAKDCLSCTWAWMKAGARQGLEMALYPAVPSGACLFGTLIGFSARDSIEPMLISAAAAPVLLVPFGMAFMGVAHALAGFVLYMSGFDESPDPSGEILPVNLHDPRTGSKISRDHDLTQIGTSHELPRPAPSW